MHVICLGGKELLDKQFSRQENLPQRHVNHEGIMF